MKYLLVTIFAIVCFKASSQIRLGNSLPGDSSNITITTKLGIPFGEMAKLEIEVYNGDSLLWKEYQGVYLLKVNAVNNIKINDSLILRFTDETGTLANDDFNLYQLLYKKKTGSLSSTQISKMRKKYIGKRITVMAYETGQFRGTPDKYFDYKPFVPGIPHYFATTGFHFEHSLVIVSNLSK
ncbi:hypothetical protein [Ferruginibacter sp.]